MSAEVEIPVDRGYAIERAEDAFREYIGAVLAELSGKAVNQKQFSNACEKFSSAGLEAAKNFMEQINAAMDSYAASDPDQKAEKKAEQAQRQVADLGPQDPAHRSVGYSVDVASNPLLKLDGANFDGFTPDKEDDKMDVKVDVDYDPKNNPTLELTLQYKNKLRHTQKFVMPPPKPSAPKPRFSAKPAPRPNSPV